ncbi:G patch domain and ankyrin repeat-containing protein 1 homolog [Musca vetustissima]|uniref:G patch domain and ankyrin repeat-containing protein 1 homolog n=1 Tax=Musca vetustissima TaxID=27455 RepID=UPI002AB6E792|nr:G patch domain and ankyrin repeat-containing protein 1 homolog [Musca vetustissima]
MDQTGEQLHPNWRALATLHIPLKRFIKEGTQQTQQGTHTTASEKYEIQGVDGKEIKEFYEELVSKETKEKKEEVHNENKSKKLERKSSKPLMKRTPFEVGKYQRYAMSNNVEELQKLDYRDQNVNVCDGYGWTALMMAACEGHEEAVRFLLQLGVDKNIKDKSGKTAMDLAKRKGHIHIQQLLETPLEENSSSSDDDAMETIEPFYCEICKRTFSETTRREHETSTIHQFNAQTPASSNKLQKFNIPPRNKGLQLMVKQGWDKESGLGPSQTGRLYPVKTVIRKQRSGLGTEQEPAKVSHFQAFDRAAIKRHNSDYYKKKPRNRNDIRREKVREWKRDRRLRNELN